MIGVALLVGVVVLIRDKLWGYTPPNTKHFGRNATDKLSKTPVIRIKAKDKPVMTEVK